MSEEEIIKELKVLIGLEEFNRLSYKENKAIQGLLDLYQKEKEKNKELENADLTTVYMNGFYDGEKKWKDKINEKIAEIKKDENPSISSFQEYAQEYSINKLQELLQEGDDYNG